MQLKAGLRPVRGFRGSVKTSMQAVTLQMAAAKKWGSKGYSHFTAAPFDFIQLKTPGIHAVLDSYEVYGGPATLILLCAAQRFCDEPPCTQWPLS